MKPPVRLIRTMMICAAAAPLLSAQVPPVSPRPAPAPRAAVAPRKPIAPRPVIAEELRSLELDMAHSAELMAHDAELMARDVRMQVEELAMLDVERIKIGAEQASLFATEMIANVDIERLAHEARELAHGAMMDLPRVADFGPVMWSGDKLLDSRPRQAWAQSDPADSLYRVAREALNRGEYRRAALLFNEVTKKHPKSQYAQSSAYWEAFARYRLGSTDDLKLALRILEGKGEAQIQLAGLPKGSNVDIPALRARVQGALAARGDREAQAQLAKEMQQGGGCDREEVGVRAEALQALGQMDIQAAMPVVKRVLARRDECTVELRRRALYLVGRQADPEAASIILDVAKNDTDTGIRSEAMRWLPRVAGDNAVPLLEELLRTSTNEQQQRSAVSALGAIDSDRSRRAVRAIIERTDAAERVRYDAILSLARERDGRSLSAEEMNYLRSLYSKLESSRLREAVLTAVSRVSTPENQQLLFTVVRNQNESSSLRASAVQRLARMETVSATDFAKLYDVADARSLREQILRGLSQRKEPEAIDKMMEVARKDTDPQIRRTAISLLSRSNNERAKKLLQELIDK